MNHTLGSDDPLPTPPSLVRSPERAVIGDILEGADVWQPQSGVQGWPSSWGEVYPQGRLLSIGTTFCWQVGRGECWYHYRARVVYWVGLWKGGGGLVIHCDAGTFLLPPSGGMIHVDGQTATYYNSMGYVQRLCQRTSLKEVLDSWR